MKYYFLCDIIKLTKIPNGEIDIETGTETKEKKITAFKVFKWIVYVLLVIIMAIIIMRLISINDPKDSKLILADDKIESDIKNLGSDFTMYTIDIRDSFDLEDAFFVNNVVYLESSQNLQLTLRCKKNRFADILTGLKSMHNVQYDKPDYAALLKLYLKVTTKSADGGDDAVDIKEVYQDHNFETDKYEYIRLSFSGVKIDYVKTKLQLYLFATDANGSAEFSEDDAIAQFTLFDINMPKAKANIKNFKLLNQ